MDTNREASSLSNLNLSTKKIIKVNDNNNNNNNNKNNNNNNNKNNNNNNIDNNNNNNNNEIRTVLIDCWKLKIEKYRIKQNKNMRRTCTE